MQWSPDGITELRSDGSAMSPSWQPGTNMLIYIRDGGSFSNLIVLDTDSGRTRRLTDSESAYQQGSQDYALDCDWISDAFWSESDIVVFSSNAESANGELGLWILRHSTELMFPSPNDFVEPGPVQKATVDAAGKYAAYTVTGEDLMTSYIGMRDLDTGQTWLAMEGALGAYDGAISPDGEWIIGTIRDSDHMNDLWLWNRETEQTVRLTHGEQASNASWDPYGEAVVYLSYVKTGFSMRAFYIDFSGDEPGIKGSTITLIDTANIDSTSRPSWNTPVS